MNVVPFPRAASADELLKGLEGLFAQVVVVGITPEDNLVVASTYVSDGETLMLMERGKYVLMWGPEE